MKTKVLLVSGENGNGVEGFLKYNILYNYTLNDWVEEIQKTGKSITKIMSNGYDWLSYRFTVELFEFDNYDPKFNEFIRENIQDHSETNDMDYFIVNEENDYYKERKETMNKVLIFKNADELTKHTTDISNLKVELLKSKDLENSYLGEYTPIGLYIDENFVNEWNKKNNTNYTNLYVDRTEYLNSHKN